MKWKERFEGELEQYAPANRKEAQAIFDKLIDALLELGASAPEEKKLELFKTAIVATNRLNDKLDGSLIETEEREELCELTNKIALACGLDPKRYGDGEGPASEWRDW